MYFLTEAFSFDWNTFWNKISDWFLTTGVRFLIGIFVVFILHKVVNIFSKKLYNKLHRKKTEETIVRVVTKTLNILLKVIIWISFIAYIGIETASISAAIASLGVAVGLALQGSLSNLAGGIIIIVMRLFKIGDYIYSNGESGTVEDIKLFYTQIVTPDNKVIFIPNGSLANNVITNVSVKDIRRVECEFFISCDTDLKMAVMTINKICYEKKEIYNDPAPFIAPKEFSNTLVKMTLRVWCRNEDYWDNYYYLMGVLKDQFVIQEIENPYNKLKVDVQGGLEKEDL